jgi:ribosomal protein L40E
VGYLAIPTGTLERAKRGKMTNRFGRIALMIGMGILFVFVGDIGMIVMTDGAPDGAKGMDISSTLFSFTLGVVAGRWALRGAEKKKMDDATRNVVAESICTQCGAPADTGRIFCRRCGAALRPPISLMSSSRKEGES